MEKRLAICRTIYAKMSEDLYVEDLRRKKKIIFLSVFLMKNAVESIIRHFQIVSKLSSLLFS